MKMISNGKFALLILTALLMANLASAFGVVTYGDPVRVRPGESIELRFALQNMVGDQDFVVRSQMSAEPGIELTLLDNTVEYDVPLGGEVPVSFKVKVPENAVIGKNFTVSATFTASPAGPEGTLSLQSAVGTKVIITVSDFTDDTNNITPEIPRQEKKGGIGGILIVLIILVIVILAVVFYVRARRAQAEK